MSASLQACRSALLYSVAALGLGVMSSAQSTSLDYVIAPNTLTPDSDFGHSIAMDGPIAVVGAPQQDNGAAGRGSCYVIDVAAGITKHELHSPTPSTSSKFGYGVAISGDYVVVTDEASDEFGVNAGAAYVFDLQTGTFLHQLHSPELQPYNSFGFSVDAEDDLAVVGRLDTGPGVGQAHLYRVSTGEHLRTFNTLGGSVAGAWFGFDVEIEDGVVAISATQDDAPFGGGKGAVHLFNISDGTHLAKITRTDSDTVGYGQALAASPGKLIVGSGFDDDAANNAGAAYVYTLPGGQLLAKLVASDATEHAGFGTSLSAFDAQVVIGAPIESSGPHWSGAAYFFDLVSLSQTAKLVAGDPAQFDVFGAQVAMAEDFTLIAALGSDAVSSESGAAYVASEGVAPDCDEDGVADPDQISTDPAVDCNSNGHPDTCDIAFSLSADLDSNGVPDECVTPPLDAAVLKVSVGSGGVQDLDITAGPQFPLNLYLILGSVTGTEPGVVVDGLTLPLNIDSYLLATLNDPNGGAISGGFGVLPTSGLGSASIAVPGGVLGSLVGLELNHAFVVFDLATSPGSPFASMVSNPVPLTLVP